MYQFRDIREFNFSIQRQPISITLIGKFTGHELDLFMEKSSNRFLIFEHDTGRFLENSSKIEHKSKNEIQRILGRDTERYFTKT